MRSSVIVTCSFLVGLVACTREDGRASTTTIRSGAMEPTFVQEPVARLTAELCRHETRCQAAEAQARTEEAKLLGEQNCVTQRAPTVEAAMNGWGCSPAVARAGYEECLAAIRTERCESRLSSIRDIPRCRGTMVCRREPQ